jgi:hypothetical protein
MMLNVDWLSFGGLKRSDGDDVEDCCWLRTVASRDVCRWLRLNKVELCLYLIVVFKCPVVVFKCLSRPERGMHL